MQNSTTNDSSKFQHDARSRAPTFGRRLPSNPPIAPILGLLQISSANHLQSTQYTPPYQFLHSRTKERPNRPESTDLITTSWVGAFFTLRFVFPLPFYSSLCMTPFLMIPQSFSATRALELPHSAEDFPPTHRSLPYAKHFESPSQNTQSLHIISPPTSSSSLTRN